MPTREDPLVARRFLCGSIRTAREANGMTQEQVAKELDWSHSKFVRIENGNVGLSVTDLRALLRLLGVTDADTVAKLVNAARVAKRQPWHKKYVNALDAGFDAYLSYEGTASVIMAFQTLTIPGLLQTEAYARAVLQANNASHVSERLELRRERQLLLERADAPALLCVIDEAVLHRQVGGTSVMHDQLVRLGEAAERASTSIAVIPYSAGAHPSMTESFTVLHSDSWEEDVLFREGALRTATDYLDHGLIAGYRARFGQLLDMSLSAGESGWLIGAVAEELRGSAPAPRPAQTEQQG